MFPKRELGGVERALSQQAVQQSWFHVWSAPHGVIQGPPGLNLSALGQKVITFQVEKSHECVFRPNSIDSIDQYIALSPLGEKTVC